jgi:hypothetical protein
MMRQAHTQVRQHAPENGESSGGLLVELVEDSPRQALQVIERTGWCRSHLACRTGNSSLSLQHHQALSLKTSTMKGEDTRQS